MADGTRRAPTRSMTIAVASHREARAFATTHEAVCDRCGHGESLHPMRELACLVCDQRASAGLRSAFCVGFRYDGLERTSADGGARRQTALGH